MNEKKIIIKIQPLRGYSFAMLLHSALLLSLALAITAEPSEKPSTEAEAEVPEAGAKVEVVSEVEVGRALSAVVVVAPLSPSQQRLLRASPAFPVQRRVAACGRRVFPRWLLRAGAGCDCASALDHSLRQLARWAREARGMPTAVVSALHPLDADAEPIVISVSLPETPRKEQNGKDLLDEAAFLGNVFGGRKLLGQFDDDSVEGDVEIDPLEDESIESRENRKSMPPASEDSEETTVAASTPSHKDDILRLSLSLDSNLGVDVKKEDRDTDNSSELVFTESKERPLQEGKPSSAEVISQVDTEKNENAQSKGHRGGKCRAGCEICGGAGSNSSLFAAQAPRVSDPHGVLLARWLQELLAVAAGAGAGAEEESSALLSAVRRALGAIQEAAGRGANGSLIIVRSVAPLSDETLSALLRGLLGLQLGNATDGEGRLVAVVDACPALLDRSLGVFVHGAGADHVRSAASLEGLVRELQAALLPAHAAAEQAHQPGPAERAERRARGAAELARLRAVQCANRTCLAFALHPPRDRQRRHSKPENFYPHRRQAYEVQRSKENPIPFPDAAARQPKRRDASFFDDLLQRIVRARRALGPPSAAPPTTAPPPAAQANENIRKAESDIKNKTEAVVNVTETKAEETSDVPEGNNSSDAIPLQIKKQVDALASKSEQENENFLKTEQKEVNSTYKLKEFENKEKEYEEVNILDIEASPTNTNVMETNTTKGAKATEVESESTETSETVKKNIRATTAEPDLQRGSVAVDESDEGRLQRHEAMGEECVLQSAAGPLRARAAWLALCALLLVAR